MPREIEPRQFRSITSFRPSINPYGYWKRWLQLQGPYKRPHPRNPMNPGMPGISTMENTSVENLIKESISEQLRKHATRHVNKYMKTPDGEKLKSMVSGIIRNKISERQKKV